MLIVDWEDGMCLLMDCYWHRGCVGITWSPGHHLAANRYEFLLSQTHRRYYTWNA